MSNIQSVKARAKYIRMSPHKIRRVIDQLRGRSYQEALMILEFLPYDASGPIWQVIHSAAANAKHNYSLDMENLVINRVDVGRAFIMKRFMACGRGRSAKIEKRFTNLRIILSEKQSVDNNKIKKSKKVSN